MYEHNDSNVFIYFLSSVSQNNTGKLLLFLICMFGIMSIVYAVRGRIVSLMSKKIDMPLIDSYVSKIYNSTIHDVTSRMSGEYLSRISDLISVRRMISDIVVSLVLDIFMIVVSIVILIQTNTYLIVDSNNNIVYYSGNWIKWSI